MIRLPLFLISLLALCLLGCAATPPEATDLRQPATPRTAVIREAVSWVGRGKVVQGLLPGIYTAEKENTLGTFFKGKGEVLFMRGQKEALYTLQEGGFWLPRALDAPPRLYFTLVPGKTFNVNNTTRVATLPVSPVQAPTISGDVVSGAATSTALQSGAAPVATGLGAGIGAGIVGAIIESGRGDPLLLPPVTDPTLARQLRSAVLQ